jgi:hypothetical protein
MIAEIRREREEVSAEAAELEANTSQAAKDMWAAEEAEREAERQHIEDKRREAAELSALKKKVSAEQKENDMMARLERTKRLRSQYGDDYISVRF